MSISPPLMAAIGFAAGGVFSLLRVVFYFRKVLYGRTTTGQVCQRLAARDDPLSASQLRRVAPRRGDQDLTSTFAPPDALHRRPQSDSRPRLTRNSLISPAAW